VLVEEVAQLLLRELLDDQAEQQEVGVAVEEAAAGCEIEMAVAQAGGQQVGRPRRLVEAVAAQPQQFEEIRETAAVAHHLVDRDRQGRQLGQVLVRQVPEFELAFGRQHQRRRHRELLADGGDAEARVGPDRHAEFDAGKAIALAEFDRAALHDADDGPRGSKGRTGGGITGEQRVDAAFEGEGSD